MAIRVVMIGAGSAFTVAIAKTLVKSDVLRDCEFVLMDIDAPAFGVSSRTLDDILKSDLKLYRQDRCAECNSVL